VAEPADGESMTTSGNPGNTVPVEFELTSIATRLDDLLNYLDGSIDALLLDTLPLKTVITPLVKMYALVTQETGMATSPIAADVTDTEVVTLACALLRAQGLNPFDLAISFSLGGRDATDG
jgi:hypothetical protein